MEVCGKVPEGTGRALWAARDVGEQLGVSVRTVFRLAASGGLPDAVRVGQRRRWRRAEMLRWIEAGLPARDDWERHRRGGAA